MKEHPVIPIAILVTVILVLSLYVMGFTRTTLKSLLAVIHWLNPLPGLINPYSGTLLTIMVAGLYLGATWLFNGNFWGLIPLLIGILISTGFRFPEEASPSKVWLLTFFGWITTTKVTGLTLLLDFKKVHIISKVEVELKQTDLNIELTKSILCSDRAYIEGTVSISYMPDDKDDGIGFVDNDGIWKSGGEKLREYINANMKDEKAVKSQLDDILTAWVQLFANTHTSHELETRQQEYGDVILEDIIGTRRVPTTTGNNSLDNARGLGLRLKKFKLIIKPPATIITARNDVQIQEAKRRAELVTTETINKQIAERLKLYFEGYRDPVSGILVVPPTDPARIPSLDVIRAQIIQENLEHDGKLTQVMNQGGLNAMLVQP